MNVKRFFAALIGSLFLLFCGVIPASAVNLPDGAVKGLPEKLTAMDSSGKMVNSDTGEYFFIVEGMEFATVYTKDIQIMNLRDDAAYNIYFYVEPLPETKKGDIDLEENCVCTFYLDGKPFYNGTITGIGNIDLTKDAKDLGMYAPGDSHTLSCSIAWVKEPADYLIDEGHRLVDIDGTHIIKERSGKDSISGEIEFKWIFYAAVDEDYTPPDTGMLAIDGRVWLIAISVTAFLSVIMAILLLFKKKRKRNTT